ncbi:exonuclease [Methanoculleus sp. FWC-SCC1]|uniref:Exonuclease n=1 Tax=Methanoculleus frigidifontis TaxID=2584085 RepID=A0ABT8MAS0_9EURY|nr:ribonuclease H-like domain-containing protein [Methanoculleus sp. FWC-SCC1]MDN7025027.1 exonuclease [Methanoculleus sp. FWC-SCC1]
MAGLFDQIGREWHRRVENLREYEVLTDGENGDAGFYDAHLFRSDYDRARQLQHRLLAAYRDTPLDALFDGREERTDAGTCYGIESSEPLAMQPADRERVRAAILGDLTLVRGVGDRTEARLRQVGYQTITDLTRHPRYGSNADHILRTLAFGTTADLMQHIARRHQASHPLVLAASRFHDPEDFVFLDIETLGLFSRPIILIGVAEMSGAAIVVRQYLLRGIDEEEAALSAAVERLARESACLVTFNGRAFDIPYIQDRLAYYGIGADLCMPHFDALHFSRRCWRKKVASCRLTALERAIFGIERRDDVPSAMVPKFYEAYLRTGNPGPLVPVVEHNHQDLITLARLFTHLREEWDGST